MVGAAREVLFLAAVRLVGLAAAREVLTLAAARLVSLAAAREVLTLAAARLIGLAAAREVLHPPAVFCNVTEGCKHHKKELVSKIH